MRCVYAVKQTEVVREFKLLKALLPAGAVPKLLSLNFHKELDSPSAQIQELLSYSGKVCWCHPPPNKHQTHPDNKKNKERFHVTKFVWNSKLLL